MGANSTQEGSLDSREQNVVISKTSIFVKCLIFIVIVLSFCPAYPKNSNFLFDHFTVEQGLSSANVGAIYQDRTGYLWFGTYNGVDRYDGYSFTAYKYPGDSIIIRNEFPGSISEDDEGDIWIASHSGGIEKLNTKTSTFTNHLPEPHKPKNDWSNFVLSIYADKNNVMWVGTGNGFYKYNKNSGSFTSFKHNENDIYSLGHNSVNAIYEDRSGSLWLATGGGLERFDRNTQKFYHYWHYPNNGWGERKTAMHWLLSIIEDNSGIFWLGSDAGLIEFHRDTETFIRHVYIKKNSESQPHNIILSICENGTDELLLATQAGLSTFNKKSKAFSYLIHDVKNPKSISSNLLTSIFKDRSGSIWISTTLGGVNKIDLLNPGFEKYIYDPFTKGDLSSENVFNLYEGKDSTIWVSTAKGLERFDKIGREFKNPFYITENLEVFQDSLGSILVSPNIGGLYFLDQNNKWVCYIDSLKGSNSDRIVSLYHSRSDHLWIGNLTGDLY